MSHCECWAATESYVDASGTGTLLMVGPASHPPVTGVTLAPPDRCYSGAAPPPPGGSTIGAAVVKQSFPDDGGHAPLKRTAGAPVAGSRNRRGRSRRESAVVCVGPLAPDTNAVSETL